MDFLNRLKIRLFGPTAGTGQAQTSSGSIPAPANHWTADPVIAGCQFYATLELRVPLEVLRHHGEMFQGPLERAPRYGNWIDDKYSADGIWLLKTKSWAQLATRNIEAAAALDRETSKSPQHSDIGLNLAEKAPAHNSGLNFRRCISFRSGNKTFCTTYLRCISLDESFFTTSKPGHPFALT